MSNFAWLGFINLCFLCSRNFFALGLKVIQGTFFTIYCLCCFTGRLTLKKMQKCELLKLKYVGCNVHRHRHMQHMLCQCILDCVHCTCRNIMPNVILHITALCREQSMAREGGMGHSVPGPDGFFILPHGHERFLDARATQEPQCDGHAFKQVAFEGGDRTKACINP